ncbi:MAG: hypothetical protein HKN57_11320 [Xanthomonadales bacterium]|nr:hypothetical protein [Gammaproteobacteria bacterium]MBT8052935.1 hypothetical protein [Gammaproteobacteria bacterium]NND57827.1 hypothetical protein [Xanthomonadales bacterium]NNK50706.1 hypothetical protein [Xanthomonadales bacterium]
MRLQLILFAAFILALAADAPAGELVREFSGTRSMETAEFDIKAPWLVDWRVNSDFPSSMGISVTLASGGTGVHAGTVFKTKAPGNGLRLIEESGRFKFKVDAAITNWTLKVIQLTPEEVELYAPQKKIDF